MDEARPQDSFVLTPDEKPAVEAPSLAAPEPASPAEGEKAVPPGTPSEAKPRFAAQRAALLGLITRLRASLSRPKIEKEPGQQAGTEAHEESSESNFDEYNPIIEPEASEKSSQEIFRDLGQQLKERREALSLTIEEVERHIHVRAAFLRGLEAGALDELPSPVQTRGMFLNYANFLDLDVDSLLLRFADGLQVRHRERHPQKPQRGRPIKVNEKVPPLSTFIAGDLLIGGGMIILLILFTIWGVSRVVVMRSQFYPQVTAPAISNILAVTSLATVSQEVTLIPAESTSVPFTPLATSITAILPANVGVKLNVIAVERTYMRVTVDGKIEFDGEATPGTAYPFEAKSEVEVLVGSASGLSITYNGNNLGLMGTFGQVVDNVYSAHGVATPTATPLPSGTATPRFTPTPTRTPSFTPTSGE